MERLIKKIAKVDWGLVFLCTMWALTGAYLFIGGMFR